MTYPNGVATTYEYDPASRLTRLSAKKDLAVITDFQYSYDPVDNRTQKTTPELTEDYGYDKLSQLTDVNRTGTAAAHWAYRYDKVGNRTAEQADGEVTSGTHDNMNRLLSKQAGGALLFAGSVNEPATVTVQGAPAGAAADNTFGEDATVPPGTSTVDVQATDASGNVRTNTYEVTQGTGTAATYTYDANGNIETKVEGGSTWNYTWNAENELTRVTKDGAEVARYAYDPQGRRVEKAAGGVTTSYTYMARSIIRETHDPGTTYRYVHGTGVDEALARESDSGPTIYSHADGLGSVVSTTDQQGVVLSTRRYDAWGNEELAAGEAGYAFTGREWDPETGLYYYRARYYDPTGGRFLSEDPIGFLEGPNFYSYVNNRPTTLVDPTGKFGLGGAVVVVIVIAAVAVYVFGPERVWTVVKTVVGAVPKAGGRAGGAPGVGEAVGTAEAAGPTYEAAWRTKKRQRKEAKIQCQDPSLANHPACTGELDPLCLFPYWAQLPCCRQSHPGENMP